jgi:putative membrane protein
MGFGMFGGMFLFWIVLIGLAVLFVRGLFQTNQSANRKKTNEELSASQILEQRYARGEITQEQFRLMQQDLQ